MTTQNDLDRLLGDWFAAEAAATPPREPLMRIVQTTRGLRPRPALVSRIGSAWIGSGSASGTRNGIAALRPAGVFAVIVLLALALIGGAVLVLSRLPAPPRPPHAYLNEFVALPDLSTPMAFPNAVPLLDGRVLVIGYEAASDTRTVTAVVHDPTTGTSVSTGPMVSAGSPAVRLLDGRVLIAGDGVIQVFDPATMRFAPAAPMITPRSSPAMALLRDGRVLIAGGVTPDQHTELDSAELFDSKTMTFSTTGTMSDRSVGLLATLGDGRVFVPSYPNAQVYDPTTGTFSVVGVMPAFPATAAVVLPDDGVVIVGGWSLGDRGFAAMWDATSQAFTSALDPPRLVSTATLLGDSRILLTGGRDTSWAGTFDPATLATTEIKPPEAWRSAATRLDDGRVLVVGGLIDGKLRPGPGGGSAAPAVPTVEVFQ